MIGYHEELMVKSKKSSIIILWSKKLLFLRKRMGG